MIIESIISAILVCSFGGILLILVRKFPILNSLPQNGTAGIRDHHVVLKIETRIKDVLVIFKKQIFLHKFLSWVKVMTLKIETKIDSSLHKIRKNAQQIDKDIKNKKK